MSMKRTGIMRFLGVLAIAAAVFAVSGCSPKGDSIRDIIDDFIGAVNANDAGGVKATLDSDAASYNTAATSSWFTTYFPNRPYSITSFAGSSETATVTFTGTSGTLNYHFEMSEEKGTLFEGGTYYIRTITNTDTQDQFFK